MSFPSKGYQRHVNKALDRAHKDAQESVQSFDAARDRLVIFSDQHRGVRDGADDFRDSQNPYHAAMGYYFEKGYTLAVLGDVEELWENDREPVLDKYRTTLELEKAFREDQQRYLRFWGNHDDDWRFESLVAKHLGPIFPGISVRESLLLAVQEDGAAIGRILLVHGHQGTLFSDRLGAVSKVFIRSIWRPLQRCTGRPRLWWWEKTSPTRTWWRAPQGSGPLSVTRTIPGSHR